MTVDLVIRNARVAAMLGGWNVIEDGAVAIKDGKIAWVGNSSAAPTSEQVFDAKSRWLVPGLIDCHTHLVYAGDRSHEFELRLAGKSYQEISTAGGGILSTVAATRLASEQQ